MTYSPYEDPHGMGTGETTPVRLSPQVKCKTPECLHSTRDASGYCRDCSEREYARFLRHAMSNPSALRNF